MFTVVFWGDICRFKESVPLYSSLQDALFAQSFWESVSSLMDKNEPWSIKALDSTDLESFEEENVREREWTQTSREDTLE